MAIARNNVTTTNNNGFPSSASFSHTVGAGSDRYLRVYCSYFGGSNDDTRVITSMDYGGVAMSLVTGSRSQQGSWTTEIWELVNPASGTDSINVTWAGSGVSYGLTAIDYTGVDQSTPSGTASTAVGNSTSPSTSVSSATGELVGDVIITPGDTVSTITPGSGQTERSDHSSGTDNWSTHQATSDEDGAASVTMSWTFDTGDLWSISAAPIQEAGGGFTESLSDPATATDAVTQDRTTAESLSDTAQATDSVSVTIDAATITETLSDNAVAGDGALDVSRELGVSDAAEANDALANTRTSTGQPTDAAQAADAVSGARGFTATLSDAAQAGDAVSEDVDPIADVTGQLIDPATAGDAAITVTITRGEGLSDAATAGDAVSATFTLAEALSDPAVAGDAANLALVFTAALSDPAVAAGQVDIGRAWTETVSDPATGTDALSVSVVEGVADLKMRPPFRARIIDPERNARIIDPERNARWV